MHKPPTRASKGQTDLRLHRIRAVAVASGSLAERLLLRRVGISVAESRVLRALNEHPGSTAAEVGSSILLTPVQVGRCVARLRKLKLVRSAPHAIDGRAMELSLTQRGEEAHVAAAEITSVIQYWTIRNLNCEEWSALDALLDKLVRSTEYAERDIDELVSSLSAKPLVRSSRKPL
jgi:DNA-binding MarR family transcriptional regulator